MNDRFNEREIALYIFLDIVKDRGYNNIVLYNTLKKYNNLTKIQKAFITEIVNGSLRNLIHIDYIINKFSKINITKMKPFILNIIRLSVYQIKFMDKVPVSAVCDEAVKLTKLKGFKNLSGFVNGIIRNISRNINNIEYPCKKNDILNYISIIYSQPLWLLQYWSESMDIELIERICKKNLESPRLTLCVNTLKINRDNLIERLKDEGMYAEEGKFNDRAIYIKKSSNIRDSKSYKEGLYHIMDESSMFVLEVSDIKETDIVYDICAAPGGKSFYLSYLMNNKGIIKSYDIYDAKLNLILRSIDRLGIKNVKVEKKDATIYDIEKDSTADCVILDVPCTGFGLMRKKADIKYKKTIEDVKNLSKLQRQILANSQNYTKIGGSLIYSTCTISEEENLKNIKWFVSNFKYDLVDIRPYIKNYSNLETAKFGYVQFLPNIHNTDGFFIARMVRKE